jgi:hypothetical protein
MNKPVSYPLAQLLKNKKLHILSSNQYVLTKAINPPSK